MIMKTYPRKNWGQDVAYDRKQVEGEEAGDGHEVLPRHQERRVHPLHI